MNVQKTNTNTASRIDPNNRKLPGVTVRSSLGGVDGMLMVSGMRKFEW